MAAEPVVTSWDIHLAGETPAQVISPAPRSVWHELLAADPEALVFQSPAWTDAMCATGEYADASHLYQYADGRSLLLPMVRRTGLPGLLSYEASMPNAWGMGGLLSTAPLRSSDTALVFSDLVQRKVIRTSIRPNPLFADAWARSVPPGVLALPRSAHVLDLEGGFERVWKEKFASETRTSVRKAERSGVVVECDTTGKHIPVFYELFVQSILRWASQQHEPAWLSRFRANQRDPISKFQKMADRLGSAFKLWVAWVDREPAAAIIVLQDKNASYTRGAMNKDLAGPSRANQLLHRMAIEDACQAGCKRYHMGESGSSSSLSQFKERLGAVPYSYAEYYIERVPITAADRKLRGAVKRIIGFKDAE